MIHTKYIPPDRIRSMKIYINRDKLSLSAIVEREGPDLAITGNFYGPDWKPVCPLKVDGQVVEYDPEYAYPALCWDEGGDVTVDVEARRVTRAGRNVELTNKEFGLLVLFIQNKNVALFRETLYEKVWEGEYSGDSRTLDLHVQRLRRKLGWENNLVAVYKVGYRLEVVQ